MARVSHFGFNENETKDTYVRIIQRKNRFTFLTKALDN